MNRIRFRLSVEYRVKRALELFINASTKEEKIKYSIKLKNLGVYVAPNAKIGKKTSFPHPIGIVIGEGVIIGENVTIYQNVTLGQKNGQYPVVGENSIIYPNSVIFGGISIGKNSIIGAGAIVKEDVAENAVVVGNPMRNIMTPERVMIK